MRNPLFFFCVYNVFFYFIWIFCLQFNCIASVCRLRLLLVSNILTNSLIIFIARRNLETIPKRRLLDASWLLNLSNLGCSPENERKKIHTAAIQLSDAVILHCLSCIIQWCSAILSWFLRECDDERLLIVSRLVVSGCSWAWTRERSVFTCTEQVLGGVSALRTRLQPAMEPAGNHKLPSCCKNSGQEAFFFFILVREELRLPVSGRRKKWNDGRRVGRPQWREREREGEGVLLSAAALWGEKKWLFTRICVSVTAGGEKKQEDGWH